MTEIEKADFENKKRYLKRYKKNRYCVLRLEKKLKFLDEKITGLQSSKFSYTPRGGEPITSADLIADKMDLEKRIQKLKVKSERLKSEILEIIDDLDNAIFCEVLEAFFVDCKTIEEIADDQGYTTRHVYRLYYKAVSSVNINQQNREL